MTRESNDPPIPWVLYLSELIGTALLVLIGLSLVILMFGAARPGPEADQLPSVSSVNALGMGEVGGRLCGRSLTPPCLPGGGPGAAATVRQDDAGARLGGRYFDLEQEPERLRLDLQWEEIERGRALAVLDEAQSWPEPLPRLRSAIEPRPPPQRPLSLAAVNGQTWNATQIGQSLVLSYHTVNSR